MKEGGAAASVRHQPLVVAESVLESGSSKDLRGRDRVSVAPTRVCSPIRVQFRPMRGCVGVAPSRRRDPARMQIRCGRAALHGCESGEDAHPLSSPSNPALPNTVVVCDRCKGATLTPRNNAQLIRMNAASQRCVVGADVGMWL